MIITHHPYIIPHVHNHHQSIAIMILIPSIPNFFTAAPVTRQIRGRHTEKCGAPFEKPSEFESSEHRHFEAGDDLRRSARQIGRSARHLPQDYTYVMCSIMQPIQILSSAPGCPVLQTCLSQSTLCYQKNFFLLPHQN
ncbi:unnamed protein product, partial [Nesidiocoris tenuis]